MVNAVRALVIRATDSNSTLAERHEAFGGLVRSFQDMAFACAYAVLGDFHLAEEPHKKPFFPPGKSFLSSASRKHSRAGLGVSC
jgi:hypothetical protein